MLLNFSLILATSIAVAITVHADPEGFSGALDVSSVHGRAKVFDSLTRTRIQALGPPGPAAEVTIDWLLENPATATFKPPVSFEKGLIRSVTRIGKTTLTRTLLASDRLPAIFIHCLVDQPGALSFRVSLSTTPDTPVRIEDRRQLVNSPTSGTVAAHVWVIPFESDVATEGSSITVRGEGEALIVITFSEEKADWQNLAATWAQLGNTYDPGHSHPNPSKIWEGLLKTHQAIEDKP